MSYKNRNALLWVGKIYPPTQKPTHFLARPRIQSVCIVICKHRALLLVLFSKYVYLLQLIPNKHILHLSKQLTLPHKVNPFMLKSGQKKPNNFSKIFQINALFGKISERDMLSGILLTTIPPIFCFSFSNFKKLLSKVQKAISRGSF